MQFHDGNGLFIFRFFPPVVSALMKNEKMEDSDVSKYPLKVI